MQMDTLRIFFHKNIQSSRVPAKTVLILYIPIFLCVFILTKKSTHSMQMDTLRIFFFTKISKVVGYLPKQL